MDDREKAFARQLAHEVALNKDAIAEVLQKSKVGQCGGQCRGVREKDLRDLCPDCFQALEAEADEIFAASPILRLFGDTMDTQN